MHLEGCLVYNKRFVIAPNNKLLAHKDKEEIIAWLTDGVSVRDIEARLAQRYPKARQGHLRVSFSTIQAFKKNHLNLNQDLIEKVRESKRLSMQLVKKEEIKQEVENTRAYKEAIKNLAEVEMDTKQQILKVWTVIESRIETLFGKVSEFDFIDKDTEKLLQGYLKQFMEVIDQHKKYEEGYREQVDVNVNVNVMTSQVTMMQDAMREALREVDPGLTVAFMGKLNEKMREATMEGGAVGVRHSAVLDHALGSKIQDAEFE